MRHYSLTDLELFSAVADEKNLTRGAERVHLSAPSASLRLKKLEEALGVTLLTRTPRGVELTPAGQMVNKSAKQVNWELESLEQKITPWADREKGIIRIVANYGAIDFLPEDISDYMATTPGTRILLEQQASSEVVQTVAEGRADVGLCAYEGTYPGIVFSPYRENPLVIAVPENHPLAGRSCVSWADCLATEWNWVCLNTSSAMQRFMYEKTKLIGRTLTPRIEVDNQATLLKMVSRSVGIGVVSEKAFAARSDPNLRAVKFSDAWAVRHLRIVLAEDPAVRSHAGSAFADYLQNRTTA